MGIADDPVHAGKGGEFFRGALGITARDQDTGGGIAAVNCADGFAGLGVGGGGDCAGVHNDDIGGG